MKKRLGIFFVAVITFSPAILADTITPGYDLLKTIVDPSTTYQDFSANPIPGALFGPGCLPFGGVVQYRGVPFEDSGTTPLGANNLGMTDTIVRRLTAATFDPNTGISPPDANIPIELVSLSLVSVSPITVTGCTGGSQLWDLNVVDAPGNSLTQSRMVIHHTDSYGGTFTSTLNVCPVLTFTRLSDAKSFTLNTCIVNPLQEIHFSATGCWSHTAPSELVVQIPDLTSNFIPGYCPGRAGFPTCPTCDPRKSLTIETDGALKKHGVEPAGPVVGTIPTLTEWGMVVLILSLISVAIFSIYRRKTAASA